MARPLNSLSPRVMQDIRPSAHAPRPSKRLFTRRWVMLVIGGLILVAIVSSVVILLPSKPGPNLDDVWTIQDRVARHFVLPQGEDPALATVTDKSLLKTPFLQQANNGDKLLIYQKAQRVIIYRPSLDRIIDIGPVSIASVPAQ